MKMNAKITAAFVAGLAAAVMACVYALPTPQAAELPPPRVVVAECHNLNALDAEFGKHDTAQYALERLKAHCDAGSEAAVLMQVWEQDPTAGVVLEHNEY